MSTYTHKHIYVCYCLRVYIVSVYIFHTRVYVCTCIYAGSMYSCAYITDTYMYIYVHSNVRQTRICMCSASVVVLLSLTNLLILWINSTGRFTHTHKLAASRR